MFDIWTFSLGIFFYYFPFVARNLILNACVMKLQDFTYFQYSLRTITRNLRSFSSASFKYIPVTKWLPHDVQLMGARSLQLSSSLSA